MKNLKRHLVKNYTTYSGVCIGEISMSYEIIGKKLGSAPIVLVNHALTGNSDVAGNEKGWWKSIIGEHKLIDSRNYTIIAINIPGNGYDGHSLENYKAFSAKDIANLYIQTLQSLRIENIYATIGGSLGGGIAWEMAVLKPKLIEYLIPIASDWKASDWIIGQNYVQEKILKHSSQALQDSRMMAMLFYRTPASFSQKFQRTKTADNKLFNVESWLQHHGNKLSERFQLSAYLLMNHLLTSLDITSDYPSFEEAVAPIQSKVIQIAVDSDILFVKEETINTQQRLNQLGIENEYHEIKSIHGHDAFLIEFEQLTRFLTPIFQTDNKTKTYENN